MLFRLTPKCISKQLKNHFGSGINIYFEIFLHNNICIKYIIPYISRRHVFLSTILFSVDVIFPPLAAEGWHLRRGLCREILNINNLVV